MDIQYFYMSDHIRNKTLSLKHCPTEEMLADYFTKPLQGALFTHLRNHIMGAKFANGDSQTHRSVLDDDDHDTQMEASDWEQNNKDIREWSQASEREQNNEEVCGVSVSAQDQNNENICNWSEAHDQNNTDVLRANPQFGGKSGKQTYHVEKP